MRRDGAGRLSGARGLYREEHHFGVTHSGRIARGTNPDALLKMLAVEKQAVAGQGREMLAARDERDVEAGAGQHAAKKTAHRARPHHRDSLHFSSAPAGFLEY